LQETVQHAKQNSFLRIEQLCSPNSKQAETLMSAGFQMITSLRQLCVKTKSEAQGEDATGTLKFVPANRLGLEGFAAIIRATMANSQDIEELAPLADYPDTDLIENFSNGASFRELKTWFALEFENKHVGCLLTQLHPNKALEIVYLGLRPDYRGRNFASNLLSQTQRLAAANDCELIVTAVDTQNIAAMRLYQKHGFSEYAGFDYLSLDLLT
ncbi:MAG: GNAT family N-acetyltransferase, partial [Planctomycetota bacterium]